MLAALIAQGASVTAVTRDRAKLADFGDRITVLQGDLAAPSGDLCAALAGHDVLLHLAWDGLPNYRAPFHFETELPAQYAFLRRTIGAGLKKLVVTGTCFEYGMQAGELTEDMPAIPTNPYGFAKDALRRQLAFLAQTLPFDLTWARLFYMFGPGQAANALYSQLARAVAAGEPVFNMSGGEQIRDFLPVTEVARHLTALARAPGAGIVNVCSGQPRSVRGLVEGWLAANGWSIRLNLGHYPYPDYEPFAFWGNAGKLTDVSRPDA